MKRKYSLIVLFVLLTAVLIFITVSADQNGNDRWCNSDEYGCWVTDEDGGKCYIMFWSEEARAYFMGDISKPGTLVTDKPNTPGGRLGMKSPSVRTWQDLLIDMIYRHRALLEGQGNNIDELIRNNIKDLEKSIRNGEMTESDVINLINSWDDAYNKSE